MKNTNFHLLISVAISALILTGCSQGPLGESIPAEMEIIKLSIVQSEFNEFLDKKILVAGNYVGICGTGCCKDFVISEGINSIKVEPNGIEVPDFTVGLPIKIYGILKTTKSSPYIRALGIEKAK